jgi:hypothetical protein
MEGFSMPQSNERTAGLPSPHPIGLQSRCSAPLGSPPLRLCQIHAPPTPGSLPLWLCQALTMCQIHTPPGPPSVGRAGSMPCWDPHLLGHTSSMLPGSPAIKFPAPQALLGSSSTWDDWSHTPPGFPHLRPGTSLVWDNRSPSLLGSPPLRWSQAPALQAFQITAPPGSYWGHH